MVLYLRCCLAASAGITDPYVTSIADWKEQVPRITDYRFAPAAEVQPPKQQRLSGSDESEASDMYAELLVECIDVQAGRFLACPGLQSLSYVLLRHLLK